MTELQQFMNKTGLSGASIARSLGVSTGTVSLVKNGKTEALSEEILKRFTDYAANYQAKPSKTKASSIVKTSDLQMINFTCNEIVIAQEMGAIYGKAGTGKTEGIKDFISQHPEAILIETIPMISGKGLLQQILAQQGAKQAIGTAEQLLYQSAELFKKSEKILLIDEAENLTTTNLEIIRRIHDFSRVPTVLVGTYALIQNLKGRQGELFQLSSRITNHWEMQGLNNDDRTSLFGEFGKQIQQFTSDIRRSCSIYRKAHRLSQLSNEALNASHIQMAAQTAILS